MKKRVGILTSGGDCPGLNATIRGVAKALYARMGDNVEIVGILNGYHGLINGEYREMCEDDFRGILTLGGTILGTKRTPFKLMRVVARVLPEQDRTGPRHAAPADGRQIQALNAPLKQNTVSLTQRADGVFVVLLRFDLRSPAAPSCKLPRKSVS